MSHALHPAHVNLLNSQTRLPVLAGIAVRFAVTVTKWETLRKTRQHLRQLDSHLLDDIGLDRLSAKAEAAKPFWRD